MKVIFVLLASVLAGLVSFDASAQTAEDRANVLFNEAVGEMRAGRYNTAIVLFNDAYKQSPSPKSLIPIALAEVKRLDFDAADSVIAKLLANHPEAGGEAAKLAKFVRRNRDASEAAVSTAARVTNSASNVVDLTYADLVQLREDTKVVSRWSSVGTVGTILAVVGSGAMIYATVIDDDVRALNRQLSTAPNLETHDLVRDEWRTKAITQATAAIGGAVLLSTGVTMIILDLMSVDTAYQFELAPKDDGFSGSIRWEF